MRRRLPLFVLPTVLLPAATLPLHVFEPRYRRMVASCLEADRRFGLLFHDAEAGGPFQLREGSIGCVAEITEFRPIPDGRSMLVTRGIERFRISDGIENGEEYAEALVEPFHDARPPGDGIAGRRRDLLHRFERLLRAAVAADELAGFQLPDPAGGDISFKVAGYIRVEPRWHQALLEMDSEEARLDLLETLLGGS
jgi:ATP-dependent Lon protease